MDMIFWVIVWLMLNGLFMVRIILFIFRLFEFVNLIWLNGLVVFLILRIVRLVCLFINIIFVLNFCWLFRVIWILFVFLIIWWLVIIVLLVEMIIFDFRDDVICFCGCLNLLFGCLKNCWKKGLLKKGEICCCLIILWLV